MALTRSSGEPRHTFTSLDDLVAYFAAEMAELRGDLIAAEAIAVSALRVVADCGDVEIAGLEALSVAQIEAVTFSTGDADLNRDLRFHARRRAEALFAALRADASGMN